MYVWLDCVLFDGDVVDGVLEELWMIVVDYGIYVFGIVLFVDLGVFVDVVKVLENGVYDFFFKG